DSRPATGTRAADFAIDLPVLATHFDRGVHQAGGPGESVAKLFVGDVAQGPPRRDAGTPERLRLPEISDPGNELLVEQRVPDRAVLVLAAQVLGHCVEVRRVGEDVRPEPLEPAAVQLEHRTVPEHRFVLVPTEHEPGPPDTPLAAGRRYSPAARHAQVAAQYEPSVEA